MKSNNFLLSSQRSGPAKILVGAFFLLYFLTGLAVYRDYGISWDEPVQRLHAIVSASELARKWASPSLAAKIIPSSTDYVTSLITPGFEASGVIRLASYENKEYGVVFSLPLYLWERALGMDPSSAEIFYFRHLANFLLFFVAVIFFYKLARDRWRDWRIGLLAAAMLALTPRLFAEAFYNNKDLVFLSVFIIGLYFILRFLERKTLGSAWAAALLSAYAIDIRLAGVILPFLAALFYLWEIREDRRILGQRLIILLNFLAASVFFVVVFWPYLWPAPLENFQAAFSTMAHYGGAHRGEHAVLYFGRLISASDLPWHYIPGWMAITIPPLYSVLFLVGGGSFLYSLRHLDRAGASRLERRFDWLMAAAFIIPLGAVIAMGSSLYDGWRQMYFLYAPFLLIATGGFVRLRAWLHHSGKEYQADKIFIGAVLLSLALTVGQIARFHPYQNVYFNWLAGPAEGRFDRDYWGLAYRSAWEYLLQTDTRPRIRVHVSSLPGYFNLLFVEPEERARIVLTGPESADYILGGSGSPTECRYAGELKAFYAGPVRLLSVYSGRQACRAPGS